MQPSNNSPQEVQEALETVGPVALIEDQADGLRAVGRRLYAAALEKGADIKNNPIRPKDWRDQYRVAQGFADGLLYLAAELLDDESILDDPNNL